MSESSQSVQRKRKGKERKGKERKEDIDNSKHRTTRNKKGKRCLHCKQVSKLL